MRKELSPELKAKADEFIDKLYLDVASGSCSPQEQIIIRAITRFVVSICTAWWSMRELFDYMNSRRELHRLENDYARDK